jgi:predicted MPP superfamily phosphohydrolase
MISRSLLWHQYLRVALFLAIIAAVYVSAVIFAWRRARGLRTANSKLCVAEYACYLAALVGTLCIIYAYTIEPYWPEVTHVALSSPKLHVPLRIVHISDLHCDGTVRLEKRLPELIREQHPDLIVFTGDTFVKEEAIPQAKELLAQFVAIAPTYVVLGNWDSEWARVWRQNVAHPVFFEGTGIHNLAGHGESVEVRGQSIWITGAASNQQHSVPALLQEVPADKFSIFLFHFPDEVELVAPSRVDLYLAGHTHGGQIALPFYGALMTLSKYDKKYESGLHRIGNAWLYVNRGIGLEGHPPRARFFARPEITVIDVSP